MILPLQMVVKDESIQWEEILKNLVPAPLEVDPPLPREKGVIRLENGRDLAIRARKAKITSPIPANSSINSFYLF